MHSNDLGALQLPRDPGHDVDGVGTTDTTGDHTETSGVGSVRVGPDHHQTGDGVVFENDLVDNSRTWFPEPDAVLHEPSNQASISLEVSSFLDPRNTSFATLTLAQLVAKKS